MDFKIILFIPTLQMGGAERRCAALASLLNALDYDLEVVTLFAGGIFWDKIIKEGIIATHIFEKKAQSKMESLQQLLTATKTLRNIINKSNKNCIIYSWLEIPNLITRLSTRTIKTKNIGIIWSICSSGHWTYWKMYLIDRLCGLLSKKVDLVIANSIAGLNFYQKTMGFKPKRSLVIYNNIDTDKFIIDRHLGQTLRNTWLQPNETILIGIIGSIKPVKGHEIFLQAAAQVLKKAPHVRFVIIGDGEGNEKYVEELKILEKTLDIANKITWAGSHNNITDVYNALDVSCSSSHVEGYSNAICEAILCGTITIGTDVGDSAAIIGDNSFVVSKGDFQALANKMIIIAQFSQNERDKISVNNRTRLITKHNERPYHKVILEEFNTLSQNINR